MDDYISKPIRLEKLMGALMDAYDQLHQRGHGNDDG